MSSHEEQDIVHSLSVESRSNDLKGKGRQRDDSTLSTSSEHHQDIAYPPVHEDAEETRRVEENLRRWEITERQRRKAARSSTHSPNSSSLVNGVSRRASLLWSSSKTRKPSIGGSHTALQSQDNIDVIPLTHVDISPTLSPTDAIRNLHMTDPFANPPENLSPFSDAFQADTNLPHDNNQIPFGSSGDPGFSLKSTRPLSNSPRLRPPLPVPLNLPPPRTPPPIINTLSSPLSVKGDDRQEDVRWWHDWLCGCGEGPDRGGDYQAGRTNPFE